MKKRISSIMALVYTFVILLSVSGLNDVHAADGSITGYTPTEIVDSLNNWNNSYSHSSTLWFDSSSQNYFEGDTSRIARSGSDTPQNVVYNLKNISYFTVKLYAANTVDGKLKCYTSPDNTNWTELPLVHDTQVNTGTNWYRANFTPAGMIPARTNYLKVEMLNDANIWSPQIGEIRIKNVPATLTDECSDWSKVYSHTDNLSNDSSNANYVENDSSRFTRVNSDTSESIVYKLGNIYTFSVKVYFVNGITNKVRFYTSPDSNAWTQVSVTNDTPVNTLGGWWRTNFKPSGILPSGTLYLKIELLNDSNIWSPQIGRVQISGNMPIVSGQIVDELNDFSKTYSHTASLYIDNSSRSYLGGDMNRVCRSTSTYQNVVYNASADMNGFMADTYFWPSEQVVDFSFYTSPDNVNYTACTPQKKVFANTNWTRVRYQASSLPVGTRYLKIEFRNTSANNWNPQLARVTIDYGGGPLPLPDNADYTRLQRALAKVQSGQPITIGLIGGSITYGAAADSGQSWASKVQQWWDGKFPGLVTIRNIGIPSTDSEYGAYRVANQLLAYNPDLVIVEFAVNDLSNITRCENTYEGLVRHILNWSSSPAVMCLMMCMQDGINAQEHHIKFADYYDLPIIWYTNNVKHLIGQDVDSWLGFYATSSNPGGDGVHPNNAGHAKAGLYINERLEAIYNSLPQTIPQVPSIPQYLVDDTFEYATYFNYSSITPAPETVGTWTQGNTNDSTGAGWVSSTVGDELVFNVTGRSIGFGCVQSSGSTSGRAEAWVDSGTHITVESHFTGYVQHILVQSGLSSGQHKLHIKILSQTSTIGHTFEVANILTAGIN